MLSELTGGKLERSPRYRELTGPLGLAHEARGAFTAGGTLWGSMDLTREKGRPDFEPRETALLRRLAPTLATALNRQRCARGELSSNGTTSQTSPGS